MEGLFLHKNWGYSDYVVESMNKTVPEGWKKINIGDILKESRIPAAKPDSSKRLTVRLHLGGVVKRDERATDRTDATVYFERKAGQFIYGKQNLHKGAIGIVPLELDGYQSTQDVPAFDVDKNINVNWLCYYFSRPSFYNNLESIAAGTGSKRTHPKELYNKRILLPPLPEQRKIAAILSSVDNAIGKTKAVIEQTKVVKKALMQELLTRGVPGRHKKFKKTPIGEIPEEWEMVKVKNISSLITSGSRGWARYYSNIGPIFLRIGNLTKDHINLRLDNLIYVNLPENNVESFRTTTQNGDILISVTADLGIIGVVPLDFGEAYVNQHIALVRIKESNMNPRYVGHFLSAVPGQSQFRRLNDAGSKAGLNLNTVASLKIAKPRKEEQDEIARVIDKIDTHIGHELVFLANLLLVKSSMLQLLLAGEVRVKI